MTQYLVAIHHPDDDDPSIEDEAMSHDIDALNDEKAAGVRVFVGGLHPASPRDVDTGEARWQVSHPRRAIPEDQVARGRFLGG